MLLQQHINGHLIVDYDKHNFITITDDATKQKVIFHTDVIRILAKTIRKNNKSNTEMAARLNNKTSK